MQGTDFQRRIIFVADYYFCCIEEYKQKKATRATSILIKPPS
jgi:hypothetical protein